MTTLIIKAILVLLFAGGSLVGTAIGTTDGKEKDDSKLGGLAVMWVFLAVIFLALLVVV